MYAFLNQVSLAVMVLTDEALRSSEGTESATLVSIAHSDQDVERQYVSLQKYWSAVEFVRSRHQT